MREAASYPCVASVYPGVAGLYPMGRSLYPGVATFIPVGSSLYLAVAMSIPMGRSSYPDVAISILDGEDPSPSLPRCAGEGATSRPWFEPAGSRRSQLYRAPPAGPRWISSTRVDGSASRAKPRARATSRGGIMAARFQSPGAVSQIGVSVAPG
jgi:hypothetical protein